MRLVTYSAPTGPRAGAVLDGRVVDLTPHGYPDAVSFLLAGDDGIELVRRLTPSDEAPALSDVKLLSPIPKPDKFICIGLNYRDHAIESGMEMPKLPTVFTKYPNAVCGHLADIVLPKVSDQVDYECELGVVIGKRCKNVPKEDWEDVVFGYTCIHDVSARDYQLATSQWTIGKTFDTFGPVGPALVSKDEVGDPHNLRIEMVVNGETLQDSNTNQLIFDVPYLINYLSTVMTLEPGDIISTGTPPGVGFARKPPIFLKPGDDCIVRIEKLGELRNRCVSE